MPFEHIKRELNRAVRRAGIGGEVTAAMIVEASRRAILEVMGKKIGNDIEPLFIKNGTLTVQVSSSIVAEELKFRALEVIEKTNKFLGKEEVLRLSYRI